MTRDFTKIRPDGVLTNDEVAILSRGVLFNRILTDEEIRVLASGTIPPTVRPESIVATFPLDE